MRVNLFLVHGRAFGFVNTGIGLPTKDETVKTTQNSKIMTIEYFNDFLID